MEGFLVRALAAAVGLWLAAEWLDGLVFRDGVTLLMAAVLLGLVNAFVRPLVVVLTLPLTVMTLGLFLLVVNALMLGLVALLLPGLRIDGFGTALLAALVVGVVSGIGTALAGPRLPPRA